MPDIDSPNAAIARAIDVSLSYPGLPSPCVERPTLMAALIDLMSRDYDAILLDGPEETGKTTALAQFVSEHDKRCVSLFLRPVTEFTYDPVRIRFDLCNQVSWHLYGRRYTGDDQPDGGHLRTLFRRLEQKAITDRRIYFFVVDGLSDIPKESAGVRKSIVGALPIGAPSFRFLVAGSLETTGLAGNPKLRNRVQLITPFSLDEVAKLFGASLTAAQTEEIYKTCDGNIGRLASVRRILSSGVSATDIFSAIPDYAPEIFDIEWKRISHENPEVQKILECVAHTPEIATTQSIATTQKITVVEVERLVSSISCLRIESRTSRIVFVSETFRKYAVRRLKDREKPALDSAIAYLRGSASEEEAFRTVPEYLERQGDITALVSYLDTKTLTSAIRNSGSVALVLERLSRAAKIAFEHKKEDAGARYIVQAAALREVLVTKGDRAWVEAALDLHGESAALELASRAFSVEKRLHLLALIARKQRSNGIQIDKQMQEEITRVADTIDWAQIQDQALRTATDLLPVLPDVGLKILEKSLGREGDSNAVDAAVALSFLRAAMRGDAASYRRELLDRGFEKSRSQEFKGLLATITGASSADTAAEVLQDLERVPNTSEKVTLLRRWLSLHREHAEGGQVAAKLLDVVMNDAQYAPNASVFVEAVSVVSRGSLSGAEAERIVQIVEAQLPQLKPVSPTVDYIRLLSELAVARTVLGTQDPGMLLFEDAVSLKALADHGARAAGFAWMVSGCLRLQRVQGKVDDWGVLAHSDSELRRAVDDIITSTAEQADALRSLIAPLATEKLVYLETVIARVNTAFRRDELYEDLSLHLLRKPGFEKDAAGRVESVRRLIGKIHDPDSRSTVANTLASAVSEAISTGTLPARCAHQLGQELSMVVGLDERSLACATLYRSLDSADRATPEGKTLLTLGECAWEQVPNIGDKISCAFLLASRLRATEPSVASKYYEAGERFASDTPGRVARAGYAVRLTVMLYARALAATERCNGATESEWTRFWEYARQLPSKGDYAVVAAFAALQVSRTKRDVATEIVERHVKPALRQFQLEVADAPSEGDVPVISAAPALWMLHSASIDEFIGKVGQSGRDSAYDAIADYLIDGRIPGEPWGDQRRRQRPLTYEVASEVVQVLERTTTDQTFTHVVGKLSEALRDKDSPARINSNQRAELLRRIRVIAAEKLPERQYGIAHEGFLLLVQAQLLAVDGVRDGPGWEQLVNKVSNLPNSADCVFVLSELTDLIPSGYNSLRERAFHLAEAGLKSLQLVEDRLDRAQVLASQAREHFPAQCKKMLRELVEESLKVQGPNIERRRRKLLDLIYRIEPETAASIASATDEDPVRTRSRSDLKERIEDLRSGEKLRDAKEDEEREFPVERLGTIAWTELGRLNATRATNRSMHDNLALIEATSGSDLEDAYPIVCYAIEATSARYERTNEGPEYTRLLLFAVAEACELAFIAARVTNRPDQARGGSDESGSFAQASTTFVNVGGREEALQAIEGWLRSSKSTYVKVCDPYFGSSDMNLVELIGRALPRADVSLLTSLKAVGFASGRNIADDFERAWEKIPAPSRPSSCTVVATGIPVSGMFGIHNRWLILEDRGLDLGTSAGAIGGQRAHILTYMEPITRAKCEQEVDEYLVMRQKFWKEERLIYRVCTLTRE